MPTPEVAKFHPHLGKIASEIPQIDPEAEILLLIGRDLIKAHHVHDQIIGPRQTPYAQKLSLGWTIIGETCLGGAHRPDANNIVDTCNINVWHKTRVNHRASLLLPCPNTYEITVNEFKMDRDVFIKTCNDDKPGLSVEDREFLKVMDAGMEQDAKGNWIAPLPFKDRGSLPNNLKQAEKRARTLNSSLQKELIKRQHFVAFMKDILDSNHVEIAPPLEAVEECLYLPIFGL